MTDLLERLAAANPVRTDDLSPSIEGLLRRLNKSPDARPVARRTPSTVRPLQRRGLRRLTAVGAGVAAAGVAMLVVGTTGGGPSNAFAGWTASPTSPAGGETIGALDQCTSQLDQGGLRLSGGPASSGIPTSGWQPVITDTRGPFTAMILRSGSASATCLNGPSFTSTAASDRDGSGGSFSSQSAMSGGGASGSSGRASVSTFGGSSGPIKQATEADLVTSSGQHYTLVQGQVGADVSAVTLVLSDGSDVRTTLADQSFIAWWPESARVTSAQVQTGSGVSTQQLAFVQGPPAPARRPGTRQGPGPQLNSQGSSSHGSSSHASSSQSAPSAP